MTREIKNIFSTELPILLCKVDFLLNVSIFLLLFVCVCVYVSVCICVCVFGGGGSGMEGERGRERRNNYCILFHACQGHAEDDFGQNLVITVCILPFIKYP